DDPDDVGDDVEERVEAEADLLLPPSASPHRRRPPNENPTTPLRKPARPGYTFLISFSSTRKRLCGKETGHVVPLPATPWVHPDRVAGGHRHHRRADRPARPRGAEGPRGGGAHSVRQQPAPDRPGLAQPPRRPGGLPDGGDEPAGGQCRLAHQPGG